MSPGRVTHGVHGLDGLVLEFTATGTYGEVQVEMRDPASDAQAVLYVPAHDLVRAVMYAANEALDVPTHTPADPGGAQDPGSIPAPGPDSDRDSVRDSEGHD